MYLRGWGIHQKYWGRLNIHSKCTVEGQSLIVMSLGITINALTNSLLSCRKGYSTTLNRYVRELPCTQHVLVAYLRLNVIFNVCKNNLRTFSCPKLNHTLRTPQIFKGFSLDHTVTTTIKKWGVYESTFSS